MDPTNTMDLRIQAILDSRDLAMAANYMRANGISFYSISDLVRKCVHMFAYQYVHEGNPPINSREQAKEALGEYSQRGRGYDKDKSFARAPYLQSNSPPGSNVFYKSQNPPEKDIQWLMSLDPNKTREEAIEAWKSGHNKV